MGTQQSICCGNAHQFYSMLLHQMLALSPSSPSPLRPLRTFLRPPSSHSAFCLAEEEATMGVLKEEEFPVEDLLVGEEFSVDDLLNLEFVENDEGGEEVETLLENKEMEISSSASSTPSTVSFEPTLALPAHDAEEFEWVSLVMDESLSEFPSCTGVASTRTSADRSLEGGTLSCNSASRGSPSVSPTVCVLSTEAVVPIKAKRSKRSRNGSAASAAGWSISSPLLFPQSTSDSTITSSCSSSFSVPSLPHDHHNQPQILLCDSPPPAKQQKPKKRGRKPKSPLYVASAAPGERRCAHCGSQKTPQWRAGPLGAKTLCNACGVRFKSGRLLPEYRPACSPTFVSQIHSNCHRKVLEMRRNKEAAPPVTSF